MGGKEQVSVISVLRETVHLPDLIGFIFPKLTILADLRAITHIIARSGIIWGAIGGGEGRGGEGRDARNRLLIRTGNTTNDERGPITMWMDNQS